MVAGVRPEDGDVVMRPRKASQESAARKLGERLVWVTGVLHKVGLLDGFGHLSARLPGDRFLCIPKMPPGKAKVGDLLTLDMGGCVIRGRREPPAEWPIHAAIYMRRPDVRAVLHYHAESAIVLSLVGQPVRAVANCGVFFGKGTPIFDSPALITTPELGRQVAETLGNHCAVLLRGHGAVLVADSPERVLWLGVNLDKTARIQILASALGTMKAHTDEETAAIIAVEARANALEGRFLDFYR